MGVINYKAKKGLRTIRQVCQSVLLCVLICASANTQSTAQLDSNLVVKGQFHIQGGAQLWVRGDISIESDSAHFYHAGDVNIEGNLGKDNVSRYEADSTGMVIFDNEFHGNSILSDSMPIIVGEFLLENAFEKLKVEVSSDAQALHLANSSIEVRSNLELKKGDLVTGPPPGSSFPDDDYKVIISGSEPEIITGDLNKYYIAGKLRRAVTQNRTYFLPIGPKDRALKGQPVELTIYIAPDTYIDAEFTNDSFTLPGTTAYCDVASGPNNILIPDGEDDELMMDCIVGKWTIEADEPGFFYDIELLPENDLLDQCNFRFEWVAKDGELQSDCPVNDYVVEGLTSFSTFDIPGVVDTIFGINLPIELAEFTARGQNDYISLDWITQSEVNSDGFELQRSTDSENFEPIAWISGSGNSTNPLSYAFHDFNVLKNKVYYYRLKLVDLDGHFEYSEIRSAILDESGDIEIARVYPNPINPGNQSLKFTALLDGEMILTLYNSIGQVVFSNEVEVLQGFNSVTLPKDLAMGAYILVLKDEVYTRRSTVLVSR